MRLWRATNHNHVAQSHRASDTLNAIPTELAVQHAGSSSIWQLCHRSIAWLYRDSLRISRVIVEQFDVRLAGSRLAHESGAPKAELVRIIESIIPRQDSLFRDRMIERKCHDLGSICIFPNAFLWVIWTLEMAASVFGGFIENIS